MSDDLSSAEGVPPSPKAEGLGPALVSGAAPLRTLDRGRRVSSLKNKEIAEKYNRRIGMVEIQELVDLVTDDVRSIERLAMRIHIRMQKLDQLRATEEGR